MPFIQLAFKSRDYIHTPDRELIAVCLNGDAAAWNALVDRYAALIYSLCLRMGLSKADTEDVFQDICLVLLNHLAELRDTTKLASWLISATKREIWRVQRKQRAVLSSELGDSEWKMEAAEGVHMQPCGSPEIEVLAVEREQILREAMTRLPGRCRQVLTLLYNDDTAPSYTDVAAQLKVPIGSIGPIRGRCLQNLRKLLAELDY